MSVLHRFRRRPQPVPRSMTCLAVQAPVTVVAQPDARHQALAAAIAARSQCGLQAAEVLPLAELTWTVSDLAAAQGIHIPPLPLEELVPMADDLATRNVRRGYASFVPAGCLTGGQYSIGGKDFGYATDAEFGKALEAALPRDHSARLHALQHGDVTMARQRLQLLQAAQTTYVS
jgi:hypothetical protein